MIYLSGTDCYPLCSILLNSGVWILTVIMDGTPDCEPFSEILRKDSMQYLLQDTLSAQAFSPDRRECGSG